MAGTLKIRVKLPQDRTRAGTLELIDPITGGLLFGPVPVLGRAARNTAKKHGNPNADPLQPFGDTPLGEYKISNIVAIGAGTSRPVEQYGSSGAIVMSPARIGLPADQQDAAATAANNGRTGLLIHAGRQPNSPTPLPSHLKPTNGCIRILHKDLSELIQYVRNNAFLFPGTVSIEVAAVAGPQGDIDETVEETDPPPISGTTILP